MQDKIFCTVFTPTYNRKELLKRLYNSLCKQTKKDFEWVIVDDGSTDETRELVNEFINEKNEFNIIYKKQENGGKHRAINTGLDIANGQVFAIVDSDDYLTEDAIKKIKIGFNAINNKKNEIKFAGIAFQRGYSNTKAIGKTFNGNFIDAKSNERDKYNIKGDKFEVFYTNVLQENKFPEIENEKFISEALVWTRIATKGYYIRWYNDIIYICKYLEGGLTDRLEELVKENPKGYSLYIKEQVKYGNISFKQKLSHYSFYYKCRKENSNIKNIAEELDTNIIIIYLSYFMRLIIKKMRK